MNRFAAVIAATAAAAAVAAAISLPAGADQPPSLSSDAEFVSCLRSHGASIPADTQGVAIKSWLVAHKSDAGVESALQACAPNDVTPEQLSACLRDHGLQPPSSIEELKPWIARQSETDAGKTALSACGFEPRQGGDKVTAGPADVAKLATCLRDHGAAVPDGADGVALKTWLGDHGDQAEVQAALKACDAGFPDERKTTTECGGSPAPATKPAPAPKPGAAKTPDSVTLQQ